MSEPARNASDLSSQEKRALLAQLLREKTRPAEAGRPLSLGQRAIWMLHQRLPESAVYNEAFGWRIPAALADHLPAVIQTLIDRHTILRTTYSDRNGEPLQHVQQHHRPAFETVDAAVWPSEVLNERLAEAAHCPFNLQRGPVLRLYVFRRSRQEAIVLTTVHHIAIDLWSMLRLMEELQILYARQLLGAKADLPPLGYQYQDFVDWQAQMLKGPVGERLWAYWRKQLGGNLPVLALPVDQPRPAVQTYCGATHPFMLRDDLTRQLKALAQAEQTTLFTTLLAAFLTLLGRYSGQEDLLVGTRTSGRSRADFEGVVGYFANSIALRANLSGDPPFRVFLAQMRRTVHQALAHQDYPFPLLVERLVPKPDPSRSPLCDAVFILQKSARPHQAEGVPLSGMPSQSGKAGQVALAGAQAQLFPIELRVARTDLELELTTDGTVLWGWMRYNTNLFKAATITYMLERFERLLKGIVADPDQRLSDLPM